MERITAREILRAGLIVSGKLPDLYWHSNELTGNDIIVLNDLFYRCSLLEHRNASVRRLDGCPIVYTPKVKLAESCNMTEITYRTCITTLHEAGFISERVRGYAGSYGVAISSTYVNNHIISHNLKVSHDDIAKFYSSLTTILYTNELLNTESIVSIKHEEFFSKEKDIVDVLPNIVNVYVNRFITRIPIIAQEVNDPYFSSHQDDNLLNIVRTPIINRVSILIQKTASGSKLDLYKQRLSEVKTSSCSERGIINIAKYYEYKCRLAMNSTGFNALSPQNPQEHKNWKHFSKVYEVCEVNEFDYKVYLDAQFERVTHWTHNTKYPFVNQLYSEGAIKYCTIYIEETKAKMNVSKDYKLKSKKMQSVNQEVINSIIDTCEILSYHLSTAKKSKVTPEQEKALFIFENWRTMSMYYLYSIPWFKDVLDEAINIEGTKEYMEKYESIRKSKKLKELILNTAEQVEKHFELPTTIVFE